MNMPKKILIIDDEKTLLSLCELILQKHGFNVITSSTKSNAKQKLSEDVFDLVIIDCTLGIYMGESLLDEIVNNHSHTGVIVISGYFYPEEIDDCMDKGAYICMDKPFDNTQLVQTVNNYFRDRSRTTADMLN
jgi:two-component system response regulator HydG